MEILILAIALSMDACAVAIGLGAKKNAPGLALRTGLYFGVFQALMPMFGYLAGKGLIAWIAAYAHWVAFGLLAAIGAKMIYESLQEGIEADIAALTHKMMLLLAIATSVDAMAAGFSLTLMDADPYLACLLIGFVTFLLSIGGVLIGRKSGTWLEDKAELFGGIVLILIGIKLLIL